ncbi:MAG: metallophosphoesterase family protein [Haloferacaceae archaeon]
MPTIAILGDTHVPSRARTIPDWVEQQVEAADHVVHTGDFDSRRAYDRVRDLAADLTAVRGNTDPTHDLDLPTVTTLAAGGVELVVTHGDGQGSYDDRLVDRTRAHGGDGAVGVAGHTHHPRDDVVDGVRLLNPGSATGANPRDVPTMIEATADDGALDVVFHRR